MKKLVLTALATEHDLSDGAEQYLLVFNKGELRVPVSEEAAQVVIQALFGGAQVPSEVPEVEEQVVPFSQNGPVMGKVGSTYSDDGDGVDQV